MLRHGRTLVVLFGLLIVAVAIRNAPQPGQIVDSLTPRAAMPFRLMRLQMEKPDEHLLMPVAGGKVRLVANTWGAARPGGRRHEGQDLFARKGTAVVSATRGVVVRKGTGGLGGISIWVFGPGARFYYYAHLDRWAENLEVGDVVQPGDVLGFVGNTGNARTTPPHLHFGVYTGSGAMDPLPLLRDAPAAEPRKSV